MALRSDFLDGQPMWTEVPPTPPRAVQAGMFMDRPDLWPFRPLRRRKPPPPEQQPLFDSPPEAPCTL
jgi:hypothetical protein